MKRVGLVIGQLSRGGAERQLEDLAVRLRPEGYDPVVYCLSQVVEPHGPELERAGIPVRSFPRRSHFDLSRAFRLRAMLRRDRADLVHSWLLDDNAYTAAALLGSSLPWIASVRSRPLDRDPMRKRVDRWALARADRIVVNEPEITTFLGSSLGVRSGRIVVVPNGVDLERLAPSTTVETFRARFETPENAVVVLFAGRLAEVKNLPFLLDAFSRLRSGGAEPFLWLAGGGGLRRDLTERVASMGLDSVVRFLGERSDMGDVYAASDLLVLVSRSEGLPNVALEAMGTGLPVAALPGSGCDRLLRGGAAGWLARDREIASIVDALREAAADSAERKRRGGNARGLVEEEYSARGMVSRMTRLYEEVLAGSLPYSLPPDSMAP